MPVSGGKVWISDKDAQKLPVHKRTYYLEAAGNKFALAGWLVISITPVAVVIGMAVFAIKSWS